jgi:hypothetical protein
MSINVENQKKNYTDGLGVDIGYADGPSLSIPMTRLMPTVVLDTG